MFGTTASIDGSLSARMEGARQSGYADGGREGKLMLLALGKGFEQSQAIGWLNTVIEEGRADLLAQRAIDREIDAWDMSFRIMFSVTISASTSFAEMSDGRTPSIAGGNGQRSPQTALTIPAHFSRSRHATVARAAARSYRSERGRPVGGPGCAAMRGTVHARK
jgi:hypothetical protein